MINPDSTKPNSAGSAGAGDNINGRLIDFMRELPLVYAESTAAFWDDAHISKHMLDAHLNPNHDAATRRPEFVSKSADWIASIHDCGSGIKLLDLGCGPGIYAEHFHERGFSVTGVDFSKRSIDYARRRAVKRGLDISYLYSNYLDIAFEAEFDVATLIYCDFGVLSPECRGELLKKVYRALKNGGVLILDVWSEAFLKTYEQRESVCYSEGGFWSAKPYVLIERSVYYKSTANTLDRYIVITEQACECYNIWNQLYSAEKLTQELQRAGFVDSQLFDDISGKQYTGQADSICIVAKKTGRA